MGWAALRILRTLHGPAQLPFAIEKEERKKCESSPDGYDERHCGTLDLDCCIRWTLAIGKQFGGQHVMRRSCRGIIERCFIPQTPGKHSNRQPEHEEGQNSPSARIFRGQSHLARNGL